MATSKCIIFNGGNGVSDGNGGQVPTVPKCCTTNVADGIGYRYGSQATAFECTSPDSGNGIGDGDGC